jgi:SAM-dependent methyltransferase
MWGLWVLAAIILIFGFVVFRGAPYVPSHHRQVERAFDDLYPVGDKDVVVDIGSGDGIILRLASKKGARAIGYELNPILVAVSRFLSRRDKNVSIHFSDFWLTLLPPETTMVYGFMVTRDMEKVARKLQLEANRLRHPLFYISYGAAIDSRPPLRELGAHHLYKFEPLHAAKPLV